MVCAMESYFGDWSTRNWECTNCGWSGLGDDAAIELFDELFELNCPSCDSRFDLISFPTSSEIREAAQAGSEEALEMLQEVERSEEANADRAKRRQNLEQLHRTMSDDEPRLAFRFRTEGGESLSPAWLVLDANRREVYREPSGFECWEAIIELTEILLSQFGDRVHSVDAREAANELAGDDLGASGKVYRFLDEHHLLP